MPQPIRSQACANVAIVKYWGKRDEWLHLPERNSISITLDALKTSMTLHFGGVQDDELVVDERERRGAARQRVSRLLDLIWAEHVDRACERPRARIHSHSTFPYASGLASSASSMAALVVAACRAWDLELSMAELSILARRGSGSASRSIPGGFAEWLTGQRPDGLDSFAIQLHPPDYWDLRVVVALVTSAEKAVSSTEAMRHTVETSPYHGAWLHVVDDHLLRARAALLRRDLEALGSVAEESCLCMHASLMGSRSGITYFTPATLELIQQVRHLRTKGLPVWFTIDAGPHVKILTTPEHVQQVTGLLAKVPGVVGVIHSLVGGAPQIED